MFSTHRLRTVWRYASVLVMIAVVGGGGFAEAPPFALADSFHSHALPSSSGTESTEAWVQPYTEAIQPQGQRIRWNLNDGILRLAFAPNVPAEHRAWVLAGLNDWLNALNALPPTTMLPLKVEVRAWEATSSSSLQPHLRVEAIDPTHPNTPDTWKTRWEQGKRLYTAALTTPTLDEHGCLKAMHLIYNLTNASGLPQKPKVLQRTLNHELGHVLGLLGHSPNPDDLMSEQTWVGLGQSIQTTPSPADTATLQWLYQHPPTCQP